MLPGRTITPICSRHCLTQRVRHVVFQDCFLPLAQYMHVLPSDELIDIDHVRELHGA